MRSGWVVWAVWAIWCGCVGFCWDQVGKCQRAPRGTNVPRLPGDNSYKITISGNPEKYVPGEVYTVSLVGWRRQFTVQKFTGFTLVVEASESPSYHYGPRSVGTFQLYGDALTMHSDDCPNAITQTSSISKSEVQVLWTAPPAGSGCVIFRATVVANHDQWYMDDGELSKELCEEVQENEDMQPEVIYNCCACDEAKYEVTFEGQWSRHTHPKDFPSNEWLTHFSDIIGASHSANYRVWEYGGYSSDGLRQVAEWGSTRALESELKRQSDHIRTIIKARGLWHPTVNGKTFAVFRVDSRHHLMSLVSMLGPSPDWIVGVSALELCLRNCSWVDQKTLNLYPWDAGTDSGVTYESSNDPTIPREKIRRITNSYPNDPKSPFYDPTGLPMKPLARLTITRQRVYEKSCSDSSLLAVGDVLELTESDEDANRPECQVSNWAHWSQCSATCGKGLRMRSRTYVMPSKAGMASCRRQMQEKEMCAAPEPYCPGGLSFGEDEFGLEDIDQQICATTEWGQWTPCTATCGKGHRMRSRRYLDRMGRKKCQKDTTQKEMCMADIPECTGNHAEEDISAECAVTPWTDWSPCTVTCGTGATTRSRLYLVSTASSACNVKTMDKKACRGERINCTIDPSEREEVCKLDKQPGPCRGYFPRWYFDRLSQVCKEFPFGGCRGNLNNFLGYDECMSVCSMTKAPALSSYPRTDQNEYGRVVPHGLPLPDSHRIEREKVDCMVTPWSEMGPCSVTCGRGRMERRRMIKVHPQNGGKRCPRKLVKKKKCVLPKCNNGYNGLKSMSLHREEAPERHIPDHHINYGPYEEYISPALYNPTPIEEDPIHHVGQHDIYSGGPVSEDLDDGTKADCVMGEWGPWSPCTHSCGEALQQRSRTIIVSPRNGGSPCGDRFERRYCTLPPCPRPRG